MKIQLKCSKKLEEIDEKNYNQKVGDEDLQLNHNC